MSYSFSFACVSVSFLLSANAPTSERAQCAICSLTIVSLEQEALIALHIGSKSSDSKMSTRLPLTSIDDVVWWKLTKKINCIPCDPSFFLLKIRYREPT